MLISTDLVDPHYPRMAHRAFGRGDLTSGSTILRGLRDLGYADTAAALAALIDNAIDAGAGRVDIVFDGDGHGPAAIAVIDNGYGMVPEMMRAACAFGVTFSLGDGPHLARNGFGLPTAPFSIARRFNLYSCPHGQALHRLDMDLSVQSPIAQRTGFPAFVADHIARDFREWTRGTAVVMSDLDRLAPRSTARLKTELERHLGFVFGRLFATLDLRIDNVRVRPIDPLFVEPGAVNGKCWRADLIERSTIIVDGAAISSTLSCIEPVGDGRASGRRGTASDLASSFAAMHGGLVISRLGRRLAVVRNSPLFNFTTADWRLRAEIDFPPALDDLFAPTLCMQQVHVADRVWRALRGAGLGAQIELLRRKLRRASTPSHASDASCLANPPASPRRRNRCSK